MINATTKTSHTTIMAPTLYIYIHIYIYIFFFFTYGLFPLKGVAIMKKKTKNTHCPTHTFAAILGWIPSTTDFHSQPPSRFIKSCWKLTNSSSNPPTYTAPFTPILHANFRFLNIQTLSFQSLFHFIHPTLSLCSPHSSHIRFIHTFSQSLISRFFNISKLSKQTLIRSLKSTCTFTSSTNIYIWNPINSFKAKNITQIIHLYSFD